MYEAWTGEKSPLSHLRTFGALATARKPGKRPAKADHHTAHGVLLGYGATTTNVHYFDQTTNREKLSTHHIIDEAHYGKTHHPPGPHILMNMGYDQQHLLPAIITLPSLSQYPLCSLHKPLAPFYSKLLPLPMNEFAGVTPVTISDVDRNNSVTVTYSTYPFGPSFPKTIIVSGIHPILGLDLH
jgi:hypothetical protein